MLIQIGFIVLLLLFAILRRTAGNYGRLALIRKDDDESGWAQIFYSEAAGPGEESGGDEDEEATFDSLGPGELGGRDTDSVITGDFSEAWSPCHPLCKCFLKQLKSHCLHTVSAQFG